MATTQTYETSPTTLPQRPSQRPSRTSLRTDASRLQRANEGYISSMLRTKSRRRRAGSVASV